jgi:hypothetical protein
MIDIVLEALGLKRENLSTYQDFPLSDDVFLRLRVSDHGVNLSTWYRKNQEQREENPSLPKLHLSTNVAITFAPNKEECAAKGISFPQKAINKTGVKTAAGNNVKPQFSVGHIQYASWLIDDGDIEQIAAAVVAFTQKGFYADPLGLASGKVLAWKDTSNLPPQKLKDYDVTLFAPGIAPPKSRS